MMAARILVGLGLVLLCAGCGGKQDNSASQSGQATSQSKPAESAATTSAGNAPAETPASNQASNPASNQASNQASNPASNPAPAPATSPAAAPPQATVTPPPVPQHSSDKPTSIKGKKVVTTPTGLKYVDFVVGKGPAAAAGQVVSVHYAGWLQATGTKFDASIDRGEPITFPLGQHRVISGWDEGLTGMKVGGYRQLIIPPDLAYGPQGRPPVIPPASTLIFDVYLMGVQAQ